MNFTFLNSFFLHENTRRTVHRTKFSHSRLKQLLKQKYHFAFQGKTAMPGMKRDCGGAAGILGAFYLAVKQGFSQNLHAVLCLAENAVSDKATRPDDIHTLYSGTRPILFISNFL